MRPPSEEIFGLSRMIERMFNDRFPFHVNQGEMMFIANKLIELEKAVKNLENSVRAVQQAFAGNLPDESNIVRLEDFSKKGKTSCPSSKK